jgi:hypothetical protein
MMAEVLAIAMEGVEAERLDKSLKKFGWPVGAITLADEVGIDVAGHVHSFLAQVCMEICLRGYSTLLWANIYAVVCHRNSQLTLCFPHSTSASARMAATLSSFRI